MDPKDNANAGYFLAVFFKVVISLAVVVFLGLHSVNFFTFVFPADQQYYSLLGFGLTGGAVIAYMAMVKWGRLTPMSQAVALVMLLVSVVGELAAAGFGMQIEAWQKSGWVMTADDFGGMVLVVQGLGLAHAAALIIMFVGDDIRAMFPEGNVFSYLVKKDSAPSAGTFRGDDGLFVGGGLQNAKAKK